MQSGNHRFKAEAVHGVRFSTRAEAKSQVFEYIEVYCNRKRLHSTLGYVSPEAFEAKKVVEWSVRESRARSEWEKF
jgi:transposase InsO family protein